MTSFILRLIAIICMLLDHTAAVLVDPASDAYMIMRSVGRLAFPIFCFLIVEGFEHTRSVLKYMGRLALFAVIAEVPFDLAFHRRAWDFQSGQNVFLTLLLGLAAITAAGKGVPWLIKQIDQDSKLIGNRWANVLLASPVIYFCGFLADKLNTDYGFRGVLFIIVFYLFRDNRIAAAVMFALANSLEYGMHFEPVESLVNTRNYLFSFRVYGINTIQWFAALAAPFIIAYNGKPGTKKYQWMFYAFYPVHLLIIWLISIII